MEAHKNVSARLVSRQCHRLGCGAAGPSPSVVWSQVTGSRVWDPTESLQVIYELCGPGKIIRLGDPVLSPELSIWADNLRLTVLCLSVLLRKMGLCLPQNVPMRVKGDTERQLCRLQISKQMQEMILYKQIV